jgi:cation diffusion facilitator CzcD-associated flavoprotein CzcO
MERRERDVDVIVIGGGQAGLAVGYYLRRTDLSFAILDNREEPGGAWRSRWETLRLFSPAGHSSLPGWPMPRAQGERYQGDSTGAPEYPSREDTISYLRRYEERYDLPARRPVRVEAVRREGEGYVLETSEGDDSEALWRARAVVSATGTEAAPHVPSYPGQDAFRGEEMHSSAYRSPMPLMGERVVVVGAGNSGAQIMAEVSTVADATWATLDEPTFLPPDVDGRVLFGEATARYEAQQKGKEKEPAYSLHDIVQVPLVREAREAGRLEARRMFERFTPVGVVWPGGAEEPVDTVIWATGFDAALGPLAPLGVTGADGHARMDGLRAASEPRLWLVGYGNWTGFASATLIGVGRTARRAAREIEEALSAEKMPAGNPA